jgi:hypothetical protein
MLQLVTSALKIGCKTMIFRAVDVENVFLSSVVMPKRRIMLFAQSAADKTKEDLMPAAIGVLERKRNKLELGSVFVTTKASRALLESGESPDEFLVRHQSGDWGEVGSAECKENELSFCKGYRVFSIYTLSTGETIWIITQPDRSATTLLLPEEY